MTSFALIHSPLVGPTTWSQIAAVLDRPAIVPELSESGDGAFWERHAISAARAIGNESGVVLVAHSGAGPLLPAIAERLSHRPAGYIFVDAGLPKDGLSRLELMREEDAEFARSFGQYLNDGRSYPNWTDDDLRSLVPERAVREQLIAELRPRAIGFFSEPIPVSSGWPDAACGYVRLSASYDRPFADAQARGWPSRRIDAGHFRMLVDPNAVARAMMEVAEEMGL